MSPKIRVGGDAYRDQCPWADWAAGGRVKTEHDTGIVDVVDLRRPRARHEAKLTQLLDRVVGPDPDEIGHRDGPAGGSAGRHAYP